MIVDLNDTNPDGWSKDSHVLLDKSTQSSVWELHIKDFSYDKAPGVSDANRGKKVLHLTVKVKFQHVLITLKILG